MVFPRLNKRTPAELKISDFSGGINLRDGLGEIMDNQATEVSNMWWKDGILKTRPGAEYQYEIPHDGFEQFAGYTTTETKFEDVTKIVSGKLYYMASRNDSYYNRATSDDPWLPDVSHLTFSWVSDTDSITLPSITSNINRYGESNDCVIDNYLVVQHTKGIFCFIQTKYYSSDEQIEGHEAFVYKLKEDETGWDRLSERDMYIPTVVSNAKPVGDIEPQSGFQCEDGVYIDGYNELTHYYKIVYSTVNKRLLDASDPNSSHKMVYSLIEDTMSTSTMVRWNRANDTIVTATITIGQQTYTHNINKQSATLESLSFVEQTSPGDGLYLCVSGFKLYFTKTPDLDGEIATVKASDYIENNLEIIAPRNPTGGLVVPDTKVCGMSRSCWFGGDAEGISGGTRLFLCGNKDEKNLVIWSGLNEPLYFPENCYAYVGDDSQAVTAFGRQNNALVIFKERECYYTQYMQNTNITAEDLINQSVIDLSVSTTYYPIIQLHPSIGCDCPDTIQLCRNRLVWATSDGNVYTLMTQNQYSERNIYCVSGMVEPLLKEHKSSLPSAHSCDWNGHYFLFAGNAAYVMDYESYGYTYASSYGKNEDANLRIPWWVWNFSVEIGYVFTVNDALVLSSAPDAFSVPDNISISHYKMNPDQSYDSVKNGTEKIVSMFASKLFDFGTKTSRKNLDLILISFGHASDSPITVQLITDRGEEQHEICFDEGQKSDRDASFIECKVIIPTIRQILMGSVRFSCEDAMAIDGMNIRFRITGGVR